MSADVSIDDAGDTRTISIRGRFDFGLQRAFRAAYQEADEGASRFVVNLRDTEYMDSSALGMLLLLREHAQALGAQVQIRNSREEIRRILEIANFGQLFDIA